MIINNFYNKKDKEMKKLIFLAAILFWCNSVFATENGADILRETAKANHLTSFPENNPYTLKMAVNEYAKILIMAVFFDKRFA